MKKAFLSVLLVTVLCLGLSLLPTAAEGETVGAPEGIGAPELPVPTIPTDNWLDYAEVVEEKDGVYEITKAEQLAWVAKQVVMLKTDFSGKIIKLMNDIDLSAHLWTPIGHKDMAFKGSFDGQNHTVKGLIITDDANAGDHVGLFGYAAEATYDSAVIFQNINFSESYLNVTTSSCVGSLVGYADDISITNCTVSKATASGKGTVGGLIGYTDYAPISECMAENVLVSGSRIGGLVGYAYCSSVTNCTVGNATVTGSGSQVYTGGLVGSAEYFIKNCTVSRTKVIGDADSSYARCYAGGLLGKGNATDCSVKNTAVEGSANNNSIYGGYADSYTGGLTGTGNASYCFVGGVTVTGKGNDEAYTGGLAGETSSITNCAVNGVMISGETSNTGGLCGKTESGSVANSYAVVRVTNENSYFGGLVGSNSVAITNCYAHVESEHSWYGIACGNSATVTNCYYNNSATAAFKENTGRAFDCKTMTDDEMKADVFVSALNGYWDDVTDEFKYKYWARDTANINGGFPILTIPKITSLEVVAPSFKGGAIQFKFHGEHLDKVSEMSVYWAGNHYQLLLEDAAIVDASQIAASYTTTPYEWSETADGYTYKRTIYLSLDGVKTSYSFTALIPFEAKTPKVTSLSYTDTLSSAGGVVDVTLIGENLSDFDDTLTLTASSSLTTVRTTEAERVGDTIRVLLPLPANVGRSDIRYSLSVSLGSTSQSLSTSYTVTVKAPTSTEENSPLDLNGDGHVNVMDVIYLIGRITAMVS